MSDTKPTDKTKETVYELGTNREHTELDGILDEIILEKHYATHDEPKTPKRDKEILSKTYLKPVKNQ